MTQRSVTQSELRARARGQRPGPGDAPSFLAEQWTDGGTAPAGHSAAEGAGGSMSRTPIPQKDGKPLYTEAATGRTLSEKPEELTHLHGSLLVPKTHPRIRFRGKLDTLMAEILLAQTMADAAGEAALAEHLQEVLGFTRAILGAEVKETPLPGIRIEGMDTAAIRYASHHVRETCGIEHPIPEAGMGSLAMQLNLLRTKIRETELAAAGAFEDAAGNCTRKDIVEGLNRLSSYVYILFCREAARSRGKETPIPVEVSARHVHLSEEALRVLFGENYRLTPVRDLSQPGQFLSAEKVEVIGPKGNFPKVSILGPLRSRVQVEISLSDARLLGVEAPVNLSGDLTGAGDVKLVGPAGQYEAAGSAIVAKEHLHMPTPLAGEYGVRDGEHVRIRMQTARGVTLDDVIVRVSDTAGLAVHIDTDQANAAKIGGSAEGCIVR